ncbi:MAG: tetratricopeptide repeat protein [Bryobacteraceae bacterium]|nr:tetratricopeptide repeat protein [Bryobacteraceae bacterium]
MPKPEVYEVTYALEQIRRQGGLAPGELRLLVHVVEETLAGREADLNQKTIAADVFGRDLVEFDPRADSIVRTTAANLRESLLAYYAGAGRGDETVIELPKGTYVPRFSRQARLSPSAAGKLWSARVAMEARSVSGYGTAITHLDSVLAEAPNLSLALALKAEALASRAIHGWRPRPSLEDARRHVERALDHAAPAWQAWLVQGIVRQALDWDWSGAEISYGKALEASSSESSTHPWYTSFLVGRGRPWEAAMNLRKTVEHFGFSNPSYLGDVAMMLILSRDYAAAADTIHSAIQAAPHYYQHYLNLAILREAQDDPAGAVQALDQSPLRIHERPVTWGLRALFAGRSGAPQVARRRISWLSTIRRAGKYVPPSQIGACWLGAGNLDNAVRFLEESAEEREPLVAWYHAYPFFRHLHGHPGFESLLSRVGVVRY